MTRFALDTNAISYAVRGEGDVRRRLSQTRRADVGLPTICVFELWRGARMRQWGRARLAKIASLVSLYAALPLSSLAADHAADIAATLHLAGTPIGPMDALIAGIARAHGSTLITRNTGEFSRVPGLMIEDWY